uniref:hypothetical protein n=1 Tax=Nonomuraea pusilla TaxID=46177 RepID=UPI0006E222ED|nr:hypothetical protein [Nonomuraea pusilla]
MCAVYLGVGGPLVQSAVALADPANKVGNAGLVAGVSAIFATVFNPIGGALSDRTHSRFGRRDPGCSAPRWPRSPRCGCSARRAPSP